ncbi:MAG: acyl-CoA dehydrogenase [Chloroflexi bacterium]|nr:acyl-CoA dehydrogenase [Chloroflexota bacterium]
MDGSSRLDYGPAGQRRLIQRGAREFLEREIAPAVEECEKSLHPLPRETAVGFLKRLIPLGYIGGVTRQEDGGDGLDYVSYGVLLEELARTWPSLAVMTMVQSGQARFISELGTPEQKVRYLPSLLSADLISSLGMTEPNVGSSLRELKTTAAIDGKRYVVNGTKVWITNGTICDLCTLLVSTDRTRGVEGISLLLVDRRESPFESRELHKLGLRCCPTGELAFADCRVPKNSLMGEEGKGYYAGTKLLSLARSCVAVVQVGIAQAAIDAAIKYARERTQFGRPIAKFQLVQEMIADMVVETEAARLLTYKALRLAGRRGGIHFTESSSAKYYACEAAARTTARAIEVHGAYGISVECPTERLFRDARTLFAPDGTMEMHKLLIGSEVLGTGAFV